MLEKILGGWSTAPAMTRPGKPQAANLVATWKHVLDALPANILMADKQLNIIYANPAAVETMGLLRDDLRQAFGVDVRELVGGSIHRFHKQPQQVERILKSAHQLPHSTEFAFGKVQLSAKINSIRNDREQVLGYIVSWEDISEKARAQRKMAELANMVENLPVNVMFADRDLVLRYMNPASKKTLQKLQHLLPVPVDQLIGISIDRFHKSPEHQRRILSDHRNLPIRTEINFGTEMLDLLVSAIMDQQGNYVGAMATWDIITDQIQNKREAQQISDTVASSSVEMATSIQEISERVTKTAMLAETTEKLTQTTASAVHELNESSRGIEVVVELIQSLADQTNLLALNATIEAARVGNLGKGFAVVASEVKELARQTAAATETINERVGTIQKHISKVSEATEQIEQSVSQVADNSRQIAAAVEEQSATTHEFSNVAEKLASLGSNSRRS